ncbi:MAG TPA: 1-acyl-sn-glycerol-3-phosphate acyltransferase [Pirellulales bacterium]|nr:1-acyl-sn-glycerol-3-phosphate acyltransferase [Pirellulales bacterium]
MSDVVSDKPYHFVPPYHGRWWPKFFQACLPSYLDRAWGITHVECRGLDRLRGSIAAGHGVLLAPNHPRGADPFVIGWLSRAVGQPFFCMASWHLFMDGGLQAWALRRMGAFSIFREGMDRTAVNTAIEILVTAERPLVIFPEGTVSRANDRLNPLMEGTALIARSAAKRRAKTSPAGDVVIHPVALRYRYQGDVRRAIEPVLEEIERRLTWRTRPDAAPLDRIEKIADALLGLKELEYMGQPQQAGLGERQTRLIEHILQPLEAEWVKGEASGHVVARVKRVRGAILPGLIKGDLDNNEVARRWRQLGDCTLAQQLGWYPPGYLNADSPSDRILETVERFEEDLSGRVRTHRPFRVLIDVGEPIAVAAERDRHAAADPLLESIEHGLKAMLERASDEPTAQEQNLVTA